MKNIAFSWLSKNINYLIFTLLLFIVSICLIFSGYISVPARVDVKAKSQSQDIWTIYYDTGAGYNHIRAVQQSITGSQKFKTISFQLPTKHIKGIRLDPGTQPGEIFIERICYKNIFLKKCISGKELEGMTQPLHDISEMRMDGKYLYVKASGDDPYLSVDLKKSFKQTRMKLFVFAFLLSPLYFFIPLWLRRCLADTPQTEIRSASLAWYAVLTVFIVGVITYGFDLPHQRLDVPFVFEGDALIFTSATKALIEHGWFWDIPELSFPTGLNMAIFPNFPTVDYLGLKALSMFIKKSGLLLNTYWLFTFILTAVLTFWSARLIGLSRPAAFFTASLFPFIPHVFFRNIIHFSLPIYYVPLIVALAVLIAEGKLRQASPGSRFILLLGCATAGASYIYNAFFSVIVLMIAGAIALSARRYRDALAAVGAVTLIVLVVVICMSPSLSAWRLDPAAKENIMSHKSVQESDKYGLKIRTLLTPTAGSPIPFLKRIGQKIQDDFKDIDQYNETTSERLGTIGSVGFLVLIFMGIFVADDRKTSGLASRLRPLAMLNLAVVLIAVVTGFGPLFNSAVSPAIRCYNRMAVFIAFFSILCTGMILDSFLARLSARRRCLMLTFMSALMIFGIVDQSNFKSLSGATRAGYVKKYQEIKDITKQMEGSFAQGDPIYQLPYSKWPYMFDIYRNAMGAHANLMPYNVTSYFKWSWPALSGDAMHMNDTLNKQENVEQLTARLREIGFKGIWLDTAGYRDSEFDMKGFLEKRSDLEQVAVSPDGRYIVYRLRVHNGKPHA